MDILWPPRSNPFLGWKCLIYLDEGTMKNSAIIESLISRGVSKDLIAKVLSLKSWRRGFFIVAGSPLLSNPLKDIRY